MGKKVTREDALAAAETIAEYCLMKYCDESKCAFYNSKWGGCLFSTGDTYPPESWELR